MRASEKRDLLYELSKIFYPVFFKGHDELNVSVPKDFAPYNGEKYSRNWFLKEVFNFTKTNDIQQSIKKLVEFKSLNELELEKATSYQETQSSVPQNREELEKIAETRKIQREESQRTAKEQVETNIKRQKERYEIYSAKNKAAELYLEQEKEMKLPSFSEEAKNNLNYLVNTAKEDPVAFSQKLQETIVSELNKTDVFKNQKELIEVNSKQIANNFTDKLVGISESGIKNEKSAAYLYTQNPLHQTSSLVNPNDPNLIKAIPDEATRLQFARGAQEISLVLENDYSIAKTYLSPVVNKELLNYLYPTSNDIISFKISQNNSPQTISEINSKQFIDGYQNTFEENGQFTSFVKDQVTGEVKSQSFQALEGSLSKTPWYTETKGAILEKAPFLAGQEIQIAGSFFRFQPGLISIWNSQNIPFLASNVTGFINLSESNVLFTPVFNFNIGSFAVNRSVFTAADGLVGQAFGLNLGNYGIAFTKVATETGTKFAINIVTEGTAQLLAQAGTQTATAVAVEGGTVAATTAATTGTTIIAGLPAGPVGVVLSVIAGFFISLIPKVSKFIGDHKEAFIALISLPLLIFKVPAFLALSPAVIAAVMALGNTTGGFAGTVAGVFALVVAGTFSFLKKFLIYLGIGILSLGLLTAFILFIINSGAYITPPSTLASTIENPYIDVKKIILPEGSSSKNFENSNLPLTVEYKVIIKPKKSAISNIKINYECQVVKEKSTPPCPKVGGNIPSNVEGTISLGEEYSFTYKHNFSGDIFKDTLTIDTITVTADVLGFENSVEASATASVVIGDPPDECPNNAWPIAGGVGINSVTQGPFAAGCSHENMRAEAIDIGVIGEKVIAVNSGTAKVDRDDCYGKYVDIQSTCGNTVFVTRYAHLGIISIGNGAVSMGQTIGISDNTGRCTSGSHLHFDFRSPSGGRVNPPTMGKPYLIRDIPTGCCSWSSCNAGY